MTIEAQLTQVDEWLDAIGDRLFAPLDFDAPSSVDNWTSC